MFGTILGEMNTVQIDRGAEKSINGASKLKNFSHQAAQQGALHNRIYSIEDWCLDAVHIGG